MNQTKHDRPQTERFKQLIILPEWDIINKYADCRVHEGIVAHDVKEKERIRKEIQNGIDIEFSKGIIYLIMKYKEYLRRKKDEPANRM